MSEVRLHREGRAGRITLDRPDALNALTWGMVREIRAALADWRADPDVALVVIDGAGRAFCAGGDVRDLYAAARAGDHEAGRRFWADEYRMNAEIARCPKPIVAFLHGYVMGGGVGVGCHASHRVVREDSRIAMPECGIGLVPDVGGSLLLARAPGRLGELLGLTGHRMGPGDAILAGFADRYVPEGWDDLIAELCETGRTDAIGAAARPAPEAPLAALRPLVDEAMSGGTAADVAAALRASDAPEAAEFLARIEAASPLSAACALELIRRVRAADDIAAALRLEYRITSRATERGDFVEGIRAAIIDRDGAPAWRHASISDVPPEAVAAMLAPLPGGDLELED